MAKSSDNLDGKLPFLQLYVLDYQRDTRHLSPAARGAWVDILCAMHASVTRGVVIFDKVKLARLIGATVDQAVAILDELRDPQNMTGAAVANVRELENGHVELTSRRMVRDEHRRQTNRVNGCRGGNPTLVASRLTESDNRTVNRQANPRVNPPVNPKSQSQSHTGEVSPDPSGADVSKDGQKPARTRKPRAQADPLPEIEGPLDTPEFRRAWEMFVDSRRRSRYPLTSTAATLNLSTCIGICERMGIEAAVEACKTAVAFTWRGIVVPRGQNYGSNSNGRPNRPQRPTPEQRGEFAQSGGSELPIIPTDDVAE